MSSPRPSIAHRAMAHGAMRRKWMRLDSAEQQVRVTASTATAEEIYKAVEEFTNKLEMGENMTKYESDVEGGVYFVPIPCDPTAMLLTERNKLTEDVESLGWGFHFTAEPGQVGSNEPMQHLIWLSCIELEEE